MKRLVRDELTRWTIYEHWRRRWNPSLLGVTGTREKGSDEVAGSKDDPNGTNTAHGVIGTLRDQLG
jgi:hypothetical protein